MNEPAPVGVVGAGPVGLSAAILLARFGLRCAVFEQASAHSAHPKARGVRVRTMELFRQWGLEPTLRAKALPADALRFIYCETLAGDELARTGELEPGTFAASPTTSCRVAQDAVQEELLHKAHAEPAIELFDATRVSRVAQSENTVTVTTQDGRAFEFSYLIAADGARSAIRQSLGISQIGQPVSGWWQSVYWRGDLERWTSGRPCIQFITGAASGKHVQIASVDGRHRWVTLLALPPSADRPADLTPEHARDMIRRAVGDADVDIDIMDIATFRVSALNSDRYRLGRVFLAGDAAHVLPPTGGLGMNSGIQDVHNLVWKLAFVLKNWADESVLSTYEMERRPVAEANIAWSLQNGKRFGDLRRALADGDSSRIATLLAEQKDHVSALGQDLGFAYEDGFVLADGTPPPATTPAHYEPQARPGHRAPAIWLQGKSGHISTIDLYDKMLTLLIGAEGEAWRTHEEVPAYMNVLQIGVDPLIAVDSDLHFAYGITVRGAVLVRPDGHVAWRAAGLPADPATTLRTALETLDLRPHEIAGATT